MAPPYHPGMDAELSKLEQHIEQLTTLLAGQVEGNRLLRKRVAELEATNRSLDDKVRASVSRVESLLAQLPES